MASRCPSGTDTLVGSVYTSAGNKTAFAMVPPVIILLVVSVSAATFTE